MAGVLALCARPPALRRRAPLHWWKGGLAPSRPAVTRQRPEPQHGKGPDVGVAGPQEPGPPAPPLPARLPEPSAENPDGFRLIYRFPAIRACRALSRVKLLQTGITVVALPPIWALHLREVLPLGTSLYATGLACFALAMLYAMSFYLRRLVGLMYLSADGARLKVSHLTFWGRRRDLCCPVEAVVPLAEANEHRHKPLLRLRRYDTEDFLYFSLRFGQVTDREAFVLVFGEL